MKQINFKFITICFIIGFCRISIAEYRVFQLRIFKIQLNPAQSKENTTTTTEEKKTQEEILSFRDELSTLDPEQYRGYYPVGPDEVVKYVATWRCYGRTNGRDLCPNPKLAQQNPDQPK